MGSSPPGPPPTTEGDYYLTIIRAGVTRGFISKPHQCKQTIPKLLIPAQDLAYEKARTGCFQGWLVEHTIKTTMNSWVERFLRESDGQ